MHFVVHKLLKNEIAFMPFGTCTHSGRSSLFRLSGQDERMDVNNPENPGLISQNYGVSGNGFGSTDGLFFRGIKLFDFKVDFV